MAERAYWSGHVRLSLVSFPVRLYSATRSGARISFHQIHRESGERIRYEKVVPDIGPVGNEDIVKGYEVEKGKYVTFEPEEIEALKVESKHTIDLVRFVGAHEIDPLYFEKPYFLVPDGAMGQEAYRVIRDALRESGKVALGQVVLGGRESLAAIQPCGRGLLLETLRAADEVRRGSSYFEDVEEGEVDEGQIGLARELIQRKSGRFEPQKFVDHYEAALRELIEAKVEHREVRTEAPSEKGAVVIDLMQALRRSLGQEGRGGKPAPRKGSSAGGKSGPAPGAKGGSKGKKQPGKGARSTDKAKPAAGRKTA